MQSTILGNNLRKCREAMGLTQSEVAAFLQIEQSYVSKIEAGERSLSTLMLDKLSVLYGVAAEKLASELPVIPTLSCSFRRNGFKVEDLEAISVIHRLALNIEFMRKLRLGEVSR